MPVVLKMLAVVGTAAMIWVGGGIIVHTLEVYGFGALPHALHDAAAAAGEAVPALGGVVNWLVSATGAGVAGLVVGAVLIPVTSYILAPLWRKMKALRA
jgi:predicted DNA repair protein MutK